MMYDYSKRALPRAGRSQRKIESQTFTWWELKQLLRRATLRLCKLHVICFYSKILRKTGFVVIQVGISFREGLWLQNFILATRGARGVIVRLNESRKLWETWQAVTECLKKSHSKPCVCFLDWAFYCHTSGGIYHSRQLLGSLEEAKSKKKGHSWDMKENQRLLCFKEFFRFLNLETQMPKQKSFGFQILPAGKQETQRLQNYGALPEWPMRNNFFGNIKRVHDIPIVCMVRFMYINLYIHCISCISALSWSCIPAWDPARRWP